MLPAPEIADEGGAASDVAEADLSARNADLHRLLAGALRGGEVRRGHS